MLISQGTSRYVYDLGNVFVKKTPKDKKVFGKMNQRSNYIIPIKITI